MSHWSDVLAKNILIGITLVISLVIIGGLVNFWQSIQGSFGSIGGLMFMVFLGIGLPASIFYVVMQYIE